MALTCYPEGSRRELLKLSLPLMISALSVVMMVFVDRSLLAHYSTSALNAAVNAMTLGWGYLFGWMSLTSIAEVFVAQYNGAGEKEKMGSPVWQMIWLSLISVIFFVPLGIWGGYWFYGNDPKFALEIEYFSWMMLFGPSLPLYSALCAFFIGQGKTHLVTAVAIIANLINAGLDVLMIFGIPGWFEPMGVTGAAIATTGSTIFQSVILGAVFLNRSNRKECGTNQYAFNFPMFWNLFRIGLPGALFMGVELMGWAAYYYMMSITSERHITIAGITQSILILLFFFADGMSKATSTIVGNLIGAKRQSLIPNVIRSGMRLQMGFFAVCLVLVLFLGDLAVYHFLPLADETMVASLSTSVKICLVAMLFYLLFESIRMLYSGVLIAAGDTMFLLIGGSLSVWIMLVLPTYLFIVKGGGTIEFASLICVFYSLLAGLIYFWRYWNGQWKSINIL